MTDKHTPTPWAREGRDIFSPVRRELLATCYPMGESGCAEIATANAKLIVDSVNQVQQYREALEFYANKENVWYDELTGGIFELNPESDDFGAKARNVLEDK